MLQALAFHSLEIRTPGGKSPNKRVMAICLHIGLLYVFSILVVLYTWTEKANVFPPRLLPHFVYNLMRFLVRFLSLQIPCSVPGHSSSKLSNLQFNQEAEPRPLSCRMKVVKGDVLLLGIIWPARGGEMTRDIDKPICTDQLFRLWKRDDVFHRPLICHFFFWVQGELQDARLSWLSIHRCYHLWSTRTNTTQLNEDG